MWPTSNGYKCTDAYENYTLPTLTDMDGNLANTYYRDTVIHSSSFNEDNFCIVCNKQSDKINHDLYFPCIIRPKRVTQPIYGVYEQGFPRKVNQAVAEFNVSLCEECEERATALMAKSDHAVIAKDDYWDIIDEFAYQLTDPLWEKYSHKKAKQRLVQKIAKKMTVLEHARKDCPETEESPFTLIPQDILYIISRKLLEAEENELAVKIQRLYRSWYKKYRSPEMELNERTPAQITFSEAKKQKMWMRCEDCLSKRSLDNIVSYDACAHDNGCCLKYVCRTSCCYKCSSCKESIFIHSTIKNNNGNITTYRCSCGYVNKLHETWYGLTQLEHRMRYYRR